MKYEKDDLIAIKTLDNKRLTCVIVSIFSDDQYFYCYAVETGSYRLVYFQEIEFVITKDFEVDFSLNNDACELDYSFYEACANAYSYTPYFGYPYHADDDSDEDE
tara:strand:- start:988 stop:1302 length:315 start_codon:yes stop_codon:yes gene_type:complete